MILPQAGSKHLKAPMIPASDVATYRAIDMFTDDLKSQFLTLLALEIPDDVAGDND